MLLPDGRIVALERRAAALLALAVLEPGIGRLRAAMLLWPDSSDPRRNLRQQLLRFRQLFGHDLLVGIDALTLAPGALHDIDADPPAAMRPGTLLGPLLGTLDYEDCEDFAAWLSQRRVALREGRLVAARQRLDRCEAAGDLDAAVAAANTLLALDGEVENHHHELMRLHYLRGDAAAGLAAFRRLSEMLTQVYDTRPSAASEQLAGLLRAGAQHKVPAAGLRANALPVQAMPLTLKRPPLMAGRTDERAAVLQAWAEGCAVLIEGEAGLGKSRLIAELLPAAQPAPGLLAGAGRPGDGGAPYATLARMLRPWLDETALADPARQALALLVPSALPGSQAGLLPPAAQGSLRQGELATAVSALLQHHSVHTVAVDDLHFADPATLELMADLAASDEPPRRWLFAQRPAEASGAALALHDGLAELQRLRTVRLGPLDEIATTALVDTLAIPGLRGVDVAAALVRHTGGNPLFMLETLKQGLADGSLARGQLPRPAAVGALIERRLQRLSEAALTLARVAAIAGVDFSIELAESAIGVRAVQLAGAWAELQEAQVLRDEGFAHDLVHESVLRGVPQPVARRLHAEVATFLQGQRSDPARLALHWEAAGRWAEAKHSLLAAAIAARATGRYLEQATLLQRAATACEHAGDRKAGFEMLLERVQALVLYDDGEVALEAAAELELQAQTDSERLQAIACHANLRGVRMDTEAALALGERGLALALRTGDHAARLDLCCTLAYVLSVQRRNAEALERLESVREWAHDEGTPTNRQHWTTHMALVSTALGRLREAVRLHEASAALAQELNLLPELSMDYSNIADAYGAMGRPDQAAQAGQRAVALARQSGSGVVGRIELGLAMQLRDACRYEESLAMFERWQANAHNEASLVWRGVAQVWWAGLWLQLGQHARALQLLREDVDHGLNRIRALGWLYRSQAERATSQPWQASLERAGELYDALEGSGLSQRLARLSLLEPAQALEQARAVGLLAREAERTGTLIHARAREAQAAAELGLQAEARSAAQDALHWLAEGYAPDAVAGHGEVYRLVYVALVTVGEAEAARRTLRLGLQWLRERALPQVPAAFVESFLQRNPAHRALLAASGAASP